MTSLLLKSNSSSDIELMLILAKKLGIEAQKLSDTNEIQLSEKSNKTKLDHNFFDSLGLWENRVIDANTIRNEAWKIQD